MIQVCSFIVVKITYVKFNVYCRLQTTLSAEIVYKRNNIGLETMKLAPMECPKSDYLYLQSGENYNSPTIVKFIHDKPLEKIAGSSR